jgi:hypothetical protein
MVDLKAVAKDVAEGCVQAVILGLAAACVILLLMTPYIPHMMLDPYGAIRYSPPSHHKPTAAVTETTSQKCLSVFDDPTCPRIVWIKSPRMHTINRQGHIHMMVNWREKADVWSYIDAVRDQLVCVDDLFDTIRSFYSTSWDDHEAMNIVSRFVDHQFVEEMWYRQNENLLGHMSKEMIETIISAGMFGVHKFDEPFAMRPPMGADVPPSLVSPGPYGLITPSSGPIVEDLLERRLADANKLGIDAFHHELDFFLRAYARLAPIYRFETFFDTLLPNLDLFVLDKPTETDEFDRFMFESNARVEKTPLAVVVALSNENSITSLDKRRILEAYVPTMESSDMMVIFHHFMPVQMCGGVSHDQKTIASAPRTIDNPLEI